ncbi:sensor histidine kinase [Tenacibaculum sp. IMCC1]|uniref:Histidine kinase n=1 Tax=Tenacibaculum sp. Pbs-1 TaxID=3238748 RepID=A0AB33KXQ5_9FLAO
MKVVFSHKPSFLLIKYFLLLLILCTSIATKAQDPVFIQLSEKNKLPDNEFYNIHEDRKGFIWLCANKGFYRYDGKTFKNYSNPLQRGASVFNTQEDNLGRIWCNNISGQFFYIQNDELHLFKDLSDYLNGELGDFVIQNDFLWVFTVKTIYKIDLKTKQIIQQHTTKKGFGTPFSFNNTIYSGAIDYIISINKDNSITSLIETNLPYKGKKGNAISLGKSIIFKTSSTYIYSQIRNKKNSFYKLNFSQKKLESVKGLKSLEKIKLYTIFEHNDETWIATNQGVWVFAFKNAAFQLKKRFLTDKHITKIIRDKDNNYWLTSLNNGVYIIPNIHIETCNIPLKEENIKTLDKINDSTLVMGSNRGNVIFYNTNSHTSKTINLPVNEGKLSKLKYNPNQQKIYLSKGFRSYILDYKNLILEKTRFFDAAKSFSFLAHNDLLYTNHNKVVLLKNANYNGKEKFISTNKRTYDSFYDEIKHQVYVAFVDELAVYDSLWNKQVIVNNKKPIYSKSITQTANGIIWVATFKNGLLGIKNGKVIRHYTTRNGLTSNIIEKIKADQNNLWIVGVNSIQKLDILTHKFKTLTKRDGIKSYNISGIEIIGNKIYFSSDKGLFSIDKNNAFKTLHPKVYFSAVEINEKDTLITSNYTLRYNQNAIRINFNVNGFLFNQKGTYKYRLKGYNDAWLTTAIGENSIKYNSLPAGEYTFQVHPFLNSTSTNYEIKELHFFIKKPFWKTLWFILLIVSIILGATILYFKQAMLKKEKERIAQLEKISLEKELIAINLTALRSQMNPHFIFNALNSIQDLVLQQDTDASYDYIVLFAKLIRSTLNYTNQDFIPIEKELEFLNVYLQLEKLRFGDDFNYTITYDSHEELEVPSLLIQPFIENALVHGLLHKEGEKKLDITFNLSENTLQCIITDNGIGRKKSKEINLRQGNRHESFALNSIKKRLEIFQKQYVTKIGFVIEDIYKNNNPNGTRVIVTMPFKYLF